MNSTAMSAAQRAEFDDVNGPLLTLCLRAGITSTDWQTIALAWHRGDVGQRADALMLLAGPLTDLLHPGDDDDMLRGFLPRLSVVDRRNVLASIRGDLDQARIFENIYDAATLAEALGVDVRTIHDHHGQAEIEAERWRSSARWVATRGCEQ